LFVTLRFEFYSAVKIPVISIAPRMELIHASSIRPAILAQAILANSEGANGESLYHGGAKVAKRVTAGDRIWR